jgi:hypothetical protein
MQSQPLFGVMSARSSGAVRTLKILHARTVVGMVCPRIGSTDVDVYICKIWFPSLQRGA